jgi:hypothetical protein
MRNLSGDWYRCYEHKLEVVELFLEDANDTSNIEHFLR